MADLFGAGSSYTPSYATPKPPAASAPAPRQPYPNTAPPPAPSWSTAPVAYVGNVQQSAPPTAGVGMAIRQPSATYKGMSMSPAQAEAAVASDKRAAYVQQQQDWEDNLRMMESHLPGMDGSASGAANASYVPVQAPARHVTDNSMADAASFARAKDRVGQTTRASMDALRDSMAERGIQGSGIEGQGIGDIIGRGQGELGDFDREAAIRDFDAQNNIDESDYQGGLSIAMANSAGQNSMNNANANRSIQIAQNRVPALQALASLNKPQAPLY